MSIYHGDVKIVLPLAAIISESDGEKINKICQIILAHGIDEIAIGYPLNMDETIGNKAREVDAFIRKLSSVLPSNVKINRVDERLTSEQVISEATAFRGKQSPFKKKKQRKSGTVDSNAAAIILQDFVNKNEIAERWQSKNSLRKSCSLQPKARKNFSEGAEWPEVPGDAFPEIENEKL